MNSPWILALRSNAIMMASLVVFSAGGRAQESSHPAASQGGDAAVRELDSQVRELRGLIEEMRAENARSRAEMQGLRQELEDTRKLLIPLAASMSHSVGTTEAVPPQANSSSTASTFAVQTTPVASTPVPFNR